MTSMLWFMLGCWIGCGAGFLLCALAQMQSEPARVADLPLRTALHSTTARPSPNPH
jgi:hypothetical protein